MSFTITTDVFCDKCGSWTAGECANTPMRSASWRIAKNRGWTKVDGRHLCPICNGKATYKLSDGSYVFIKEMKK